MLDPLAINFVLLMIAGVILIVNKVDYGWKRVVIKLQDKGRFSAVIEFLKVLIIPDKWRSNSLRDIEFSIKSVGCVETELIKRNKQIQDLLDYTKKIYCSYESFRKEIKSLREMASRFEDGWLKSEIQETITALEVQVESYKSIYEKAILKLRQERNNFDVFKAKSSAKKVMTDAKTLVEGSPEGC